MIIIVIPPSRASLPFAYILLTYYIFLITLNVAYISHIHISHFKFSSPSPAGQAGEASRPKFTNLKIHITFPEEKAWKPGVVWSWQVCRLHPLPTPFISTPSTIPLPFPFPNDTAGNLEVPPDYSLNPTHSLTHS